MRSSKLRSVVGVVAVALVATTSASSRPTAGISVTAQEPIVAVIGSGAGGIYQVAIVVSAKFSPDALHDDARVTGISTKGLGGFAPFTGYDTGNVLHGTAVYQGIAGAVADDRILVAVKWTAYTPLVGGKIEGSKTASTVVQIPKAEPAPRLNSVRKDRLAALATKNYLKCAAHGLAAAAIPGALPGASLLGAEYCAGATWLQSMANDPVDLNFRVVAKPRPPRALKVAAGNGLSAPAAAALNELLAVLAKQIGLERAIVTAFNRSQGAHVKKQTSWEKKQVRASATYAAALSSLMLQEANIRPRVRGALSSRDGEKTSEEDAYAFQDSLIARRALPAELASNLTRLGMTKVELREIHAQLVARNHPSLYDGDPVAAIADRTDLALLRQAAADLKAFAKEATRDPLRIP